MCVIITLLSFGVTITVCLLAKRFKVKKRILKKLKKIGGGKNSVEYIHYKGFDSDQVELTTEAVRPFFNPRKRFVTDLL